MTQKTSTPISDENRAPCSSRASEMKKLIRRLNEREAELRKDNKNFHYRLIPLRKDGKKPEVPRGMSSKDEAIALSHCDAVMRIENGTGNVGVMALFAPEKTDPEKDDSEYSLVLIDIDRDKDGQLKLHREKVNKLIRTLDSLTILTSSGGYHIYCAANGRFARGLMERYGTCNLNPKYMGTDFGEFRLKNFYVVAPGSYCPPKTPGIGDGFYRVEVDKPIRIISLDDIPSWITFSKSGRKSGHKRGHKSGRSRDDTPIDCSKLTQVNPETEVNKDEIPLSHFIQNDPKFGELLKWAEYGHVQKMGAGDKRGEVDRSRNDFACAWKCRRYGFKKEQTAAILRFCRPYEKTARDDYIELTLSKVYEDVSIETAFPSTETQYVDTFASIPRERPCTIIHGLPRNGKSYNSLKHLGTFESGIYVCPNHEIIEQQFKTFSDLYPEKTSVWIKGKSKTCNWTNENGKQFDCYHCPYNPEPREDNHRREKTQITMEEEAEKLVKDKIHITAESIPDGFCKHAMLHYCEGYADFVFTVPYYTVAPDEKFALSPREVMIIDEDPSFSYYLPSSVEIYDYQNYKGRFNGGAKTDSICTSLNGIERTVEKGTLSPEAKSVILGICDGLKKINQYCLECSKKPSPEELKKLKERLERLPITERGSDTLVKDAPEEVKQEILAELAKHDYSLTEAESINQWFEPFLYPFENSPYHLLGKNPQSIYAVGNEERIIRKPDCADKFVLIGSTKAELFAELMFPDPKDRIRVQNDHFTYGENYFILELTGIGKKKDAKAQTTQLTNLLRTHTTRNKNSDWKLPGLVLTNSKEQQTRIHRSHQTETVQISKEKIERLLDCWTDGDLAIFYQNSVISRGIDIPWMDLIYVMGCGFAQPYWEAKIQYLKGIYQTKKSNGTKEWDPALDRACAMKELIVQDETTNSCLRPTPVNGKRPEQSKFIIMRQCDRDKINPHASISMKTVEIRPDTDLNLVVDILYDCASTVNPTIKRHKACGDQISMVFECDANQIEEDRLKDVIRFGKEYKDAQTIVQKLEDLSQLSSAHEESMIAEVAGRMITHTAFNTPTKGLDRTSAIKKSKLISWTKKRWRKYPDEIYEAAVTFLIITKRLTRLSTEYEHKGGNLTCDTVIEDFYLCMTPENPNFPHFITPPEEVKSGDITANLTNGKIAEGSW